LFFAGFPRAGDEGGQGGCLRIATK
jgi:hypothetical protein